MSGSNHGAHQSSGTDDPDASDFDGDLNLSVRPDRSTYGPGNVYWPGPAGLDCECGHDGVLRFSDDELTLVAQSMDANEPDYDVQMFITREVCMSHFITDFERLFPQCKFFHELALHPDLAAHAVNLQRERVWNVVIDQTETRWRWRGDSVCMDVDRRLLQDLRSNASNGI